MEDPLRQDLSAPPQIIETMGWRPGEGLRWREDHLARMAGTAARLGYAFDRDKALALLDGIEGEGPLRCRLTLDAQGEFALTTAPPPAQSAPLARGLGRSTARPCRPVDRRQNHPPRRL